ncbi:MAG: pyridoxal phosphate-dependent aminotransferase [Spirochaetes bacterium]|nr:pyridoxal phosphate-dependent aminotransferase [Spirochaetota bacterium]
MYNFNKIINRKNTNSLKWDGLKSIFGTDDILPLWVADMDIKTCQPLLKKIKKITKTGIFGYNLKPESLDSAIVNWHQKRHGIKIIEDEIIYTHGVVPALYMAIQAFTNPDDKIIIQPPVYFPFFTAINANKRKLIFNQLLEEDNYYKIDFIDLEKKAKRAKMLILCSPHNPVGRVWKYEELEKIIHICLKNKILILSDEIHSDIVYKPNRHIPTAEINKDAKDITITFNAISKTFNTAGLMSSYVICKNMKYNNIFKDYLKKINLNSINMFGSQAIETCYNHGEKWLEGLLKHLWKNYHYLVDFINDKIPQIIPSKLEATYLVWLNFKNLKLNDEDLKNFIIKDAKLGLNDGIIFGPGGSGYQRINIACPLSVLKEALIRLEKAVIRKFG